MKRLFILLVFLPMQLWAADAKDQYLLSLVRFDDMVEVVRLEGLADNADVPQEIFGREFGDNWPDALDGIFDAKALSTYLEVGFLAALADTPRGDIITFLESNAWQSALDLELEGRRAMLDPSVENAAYDMYWERFDDNDERVQDLTRLIEAGQLIDSNVVGAMNSMYQFNQGLLSEGLDVGVDEADMLAQIWAEEDALRLEISEWLYAFLLLAYDPLETRLLREQITFYESPAGQTFHRALMDGFDGLYSAISFDLGATIAIFARDELL